MGEENQPRGELDRFSMVTPIVPPLPPMTTRFHSISEIPSKEATDFSIRFGFHGNITCGFRLPRIGDRDDQVPEDDALPFHTIAFSEGGVRVPLHPLYCSFLKCVGLLPTQCSPNLHKVINGFVKLESRLPGNVHLNLDDLSHYYRLAKKSDKYVLEIRNDVYPVTHLPAHHGGYKDYIVYLTGHFETHDKCPRVAGNPESQDVFPQCLNPPHKEVIDNYCKNLSNERAAVFLLEYAHLHGSYNPGSYPLGCQKLTRARKTPTHKHLEFSFPGSRDIEVLDSSEHEPLAESSGAHCVSLYIPPSEPESEMNIPIVALEAMRKNVTKKQWNCDNKRIGTFTRRLAAHATPQANGDQDTMMMDNPGCVVTSKAVKAGCTIPSTQTVSDTQTVSGALKRPRKEDGSKGKKKVKASGTSTDMTCLSYELSGLPHFDPPFGISGEVRDQLRRLPVLPIPSDDDSEFGLLGVDPLYALYAVAPSLSFAKDRMILDGTNVIDSLAAACASTIESFIRLSHAAHKLEGVTRSLEAEKKKLVLIVSRQAVEIEKLKAQVSSAKQERAQVVQATKDEMIAEALRVAEEHYDAGMRIGKEIAWNAAIKSLKESGFASADIIRKLPNPYALIDEQLRGMDDQDPEEDGDFIGGVGADGDVEQDNG